MSETIHHQFLQIVLIFEITNLMWRNQISELFESIQLKSCQGFSGVSKICVGHGSWMNTVDSEGGFRTIFLHCLGRMRPGLLNEVGGNLTFFSPKVAGLFLMFRFPNFALDSGFFFLAVGAGSDSNSNKFWTSSGEIFCRREWSNTLKFVLTAFLIKCFYLLSLLWYRRYLYCVVIKRRRLHFRLQGRDESRRHTLTALKKILGEFLDSIYKVWETW